MIDLKGKGNEEFWSGNMVVYENMTALLLSCWINRLPYLMPS